MFAKAEAQEEIPKRVARTQNCAVKTLRYYGWRST